MDDKRSQMQTHLHIFILSNFKSQFLRQEARVITPEEVLGSHTTLSI